MVRFNHLFRIPEKELESYQTFDPEMGHYLADMALTHLLEKLSPYLGSKPIDECLRAWKNVQKRYA